ncbi:hypothetical protein [Micromonospora sp. M42]|uniref:hypothetical protein n=1 Tax=Micromonospora sp. M42 TaxID=457406 RepID=UPI000A48BE17|nr:hypothetical protein [Micromonospora sp. M42]
MVLRLVNALGGAARDSLLGRVAAELTPNARAGVAARVTLARWRPGVTSSTSGTPPRPCWPPPGAR